MESTELTIHTGRRRGVFDITEECAEFVADEGDGLLNVFVPHATCGLVIMELGAGSDPDYLATLDRLLPRDDRYAHQHGTKGHGADHVVPAFAPPSISVPVVDGRLAARDVAVDRPARHQRRQRAAERSPQLRPGVGRSAGSQQLRHCRPGRGVGRGTAGGLFAVANYPAVTRETLAPFRPVRGARGFPIRERGDHRGCLPRARQAAPSRCRVRRRVADDAAQPGAGVADRPRAPRPLRPRDRSRPANPARARSLDVDSVGCRDSDRIADGHRPTAAHGGAVPSRRSGIHADEVRAFLAELRSLDRGRAQRVWNGRAVAHTKGYTQALARRRARLEVGARQSGSSRARPRR